MAQLPTGVASFRALIISLLQKVGLLETALKLRKALHGQHNVPRPRTTQHKVLTLGDHAIDGPLLVAVSGKNGRDLIAEASIAGIDVKSVLSEAASPFALTKPDPTQLAGWLAVGDPEWVGAIKTFVLTSLDQSGRELLRGRMKSDQSLLLLRPNQTAPLPDTLGAPTWSDEGFAYYRSFPIDWLDPVGKDGRATAASLARTDWPKISMVMVSFNQAPYLEAGIRSILDQNYPNLELIMIDGGSTDGSTAILERYRDRFRVMVIEKDRGQSDGLNKGFDRTTGDIVSWLNSDDLLVPGSLFRVAAAFKRYGTDMVAGGCQQVAADGTTIVLSHHNHLPIARATPLPLADLLNFDGRWLKGCFFFQPEVFFSREIWQRSGGGLRIDLNYVLDYDLWLRMAAAGATIVHIPEYIACSRIHALQKTTFGETPFIPETRRLLAEYKDDVRWTRPHGA